MNPQAAQPAPQSQGESGSMAAPAGRARRKPWQDEPLEGSATMASRDRAQLIQRKTRGFLEPSSPGGSIAGKREGGF